MSPIDLMSVPQHQAALSAALVCMRIQVFLVCSVTPSHIANGGSGEASTSKRCDAQTLRPDSPFHLAHPLFPARPVRRAQGTFLPSVSGSASPFATSLLGRMVFFPARCPTASPLYSFSPFTRVLFTHALRCDGRHLVAVVECRASAHHSQR